jgi:hypothetical protein
MSIDSDPTCYYPPSELYTGTFTARQCSEQAVGHLILSNRNLEDHNNSLVVWLDMIRFIEFNFTAESDQTGLKSLAHRISKWVISSAEPTTLDKWVYALINCLWSHSKRCILSHLDPQDIPSVVDELTRVAVRFSGTSEIVSHSSAKYRLFSEAIMLAAEVDFWVGKLQTLPGGGIAGSRARNFTRLREFRISTDRAVTRPVNWGVVARQW